MSESHTSIESTLQEHRVFPPPAEFVAKARINTRAEYDRLYRESIDSPDTFWARAADDLHWFKKWDKVVDWNLPYAKWFVGAKTNVAYNCLDHQINQGRGEKTAILWEAEPLEEGQARVRRISFRELRDEVGKFANGLKKLGVKKGDVVTIYMPMVAEAAVAMLACARIGAAHSVIFGGFSSQAIADRVTDAASRIIITADGGHRRGAIVPLKNNVDEAIKKLEAEPATQGLVRNVVVLKHSGQEVSMTEGRDVSWADVVAGQSADCPAEPMDAEDLLFVLYTSGSTGKPKGIIHTTGGYMVGTYLSSQVRV